eukprot:c21417_g2_i4 orf=724-1641(+)
MSLTTPDTAERLEIVKGDLLVESDFVDAIRGCEGVFHLATPLITGQINDPEKDVIIPAVQGTLNVLKACARSRSVRRVVYTSSIVAVRNISQNVPPGQVFDETYWTSVEFCKQEKRPCWAYAVSKTLAEQEAIEFAKENGIDLVSIVPSMVVGPFLTPEIPTSVVIALSLVTGEETYLPFLRRASYIHVDDLAMAHIFLYEHPAAQGRYICSYRDAWIGEVSAVLSRRHPKLQIFEESAGPEQQRLYYFSSERLQKLGFGFTHTLEDMFDAAILCCTDRGLPLLSLSASLPSKNANHSHGLNCTF